MNKILVTVYVPLLDESFDIFIPINKKFGTVKKVIIDAINELSDNSIKNIESLKIYDKESGKMVENNQFVKLSGIKNGSQLIII